MTTDPEMRVSEIAGESGSSLPEEASEAEEQALLQDIDAILARIHVGIEAERKAMAALIERMDRHSA